VGDPLEGIPPKAAGWGIRGDRKLK